MQVIYITMIPHSEVYRFKMQFHTIVLQQLFLQLWQGQSVLKRAAAVIIKTHLVQLQGQNMVHTM